MNFIKCTTKSDQKKVLSYIKAHYKEDPNYIDYSTPILREIFAGKSPFSKNLWHQTYTIEDRGQCVGVVTYLIHQNYADVLQITFFEYDNNPCILKQIVETAKTLCIDKGAKEIVVGMNGHVNYGLGLTLEQTHRPTFGAMYTKPYYSMHLKALGFDETRLVSFEYPWENRTFPLSDKWRTRFHERYSFRAMTKSSYEQDLIHYTDLNNRCFGDHKFYFPRTAEEDVSLFKDLKFFLEEGSLIFAEKNGTPIGFLLWYPDWGELMSRGETLSPVTYLKKQLRKSKVRSFKLVEWAVLPEYRQLGIPVGLLAECFERVKEKAYTRCKTSWILEDNLDSSGFGFKWALPYETHGVYTLSLNRGPDA